MGLVAIVSRLDDEASPVVVHAIGGVDPAQYPNAHRLPDRMCPRGHVYLCESDDMTRAGVPASMLGSFPGGPGSTPGLATTPCAVCGGPATAEGFSHRPDCSSVTVRLPRIAAEWGNWRPIDRREGLCTIPGCFVCAGKLPERRPDAG